MAFLIGGANSASGGYEISNSGLFNDGQSQALTRTHGASGSTRTFTFSCWVKFSDTKTGSSASDCCHGLFASEEETGHQFFISTDEGQILRIADYQDSAYNLHLQTNRKFRDHSAWYHFCIIFDTTDGTEADRCKVYVNGERETSFSTAVYPSQNTDLYGNGNQAHFIGRRGGSNTMYFDGYIADVNFIDGTAAAHTEFGERDEDSGIWKPKKYSGSYGNNGFFLEFGNTGTGQGANKFASDTSGNGNHYDTNNFSGQYQMTDTPTNNFCTLNPLNLTESNASFSKGNLAFTNSLNSSPHHALAASTFAVANGKWYWEAKCEAVGGTAMSIGAIEVSEFAKNDFTGDNGVGYFNNGNFHYRGSEDSDPNTYTTGDIIGIALDMDNRAIYFHKNGTYEDSGDPTSGSSRTGSAGGELHASNATMTPAVSNYNNGNNELNFGNPIHSISSGNADANGYGNFEYAVPSGYYALCTKNLAEYG